MEGENVKTCYGTHIFLMLVCVVWLAALGCDTPVPKIPLRSALQPPLPPKPVLSVRPFKAPIMRIAVSQMAAQEVTIEYWSGTMDMAWPQKDGGLLIGSNTMAHMIGLNLIADIPVPALIPRGDKWLMSSNQAREFMMLDIRLRQEHNVALYNEGAVYHGE